VSRVETENKDPSEHREQKDPSAREEAKVSGVTMERTVNEDQPVFPDLPAPEESPELKDNRVPEAEEGIRGRLELLEHQASQECGESPEKLELSVYLDLQVRGESLENEEIRDKQDQQVQPEKSV